MQNIQLFKIGEVAKIFHVSVGILRHYEKLGLLIPEYIDNSSNYRFYSYSQFERLHKILYLRDLGLSLPQIKRIISNESIENMQTVLLEQKELIHEKIVELQAIENKIQGRIDDIEYALTSSLNKIQITKKEHLQLTILHQDIKPEKHYSLESSVLKLEGYQSRLAYLGKVGIGISKEDLMNRNLNHYSYVFIALDEGDQFKGDIKDIYNQRYITYYFKGLHKDAHQYYSLLMNYIDEHHYEINGFSLEYAVVDDGMSDNENDYITKIEIPIK